MTYPSLLTRVKAITIDSILMVLLMFAISDVFSRLDHVPTYLRILAFLFVFFLYDPWLTSARGGTIGHKFMKLKVTKIDSDEHLSFKGAFVRSSIKALLGWLSLFTVGKSKQKQAIHDIVVGSVVKFDAKAPEHSPN